MTRSTMLRRGPQAVAAGATLLLWLGGAAPAAAQERLPTQDRESASLALWKKAAVGTAALGALFLLDEPVRDLAADVQGGLGDDLAAAGSDYGAWRKTGAILAGGAVLAGAAVDGGTGARKAAAAVIGAFAGSMANESLNHALGRRRPREELGAWEFDPFHGHASFGSGHAAYTFAVAGAVDEVTDGWIAVPFYAAAVGTSLSRVYRDRHWLSDVAVGGLVGLLVGKRATRAATRLFGVARDSELSDPGPRRSILERLEPVTGSGLVGLRVRF